VYGKKFNLFLDDFFEYLGSRWMGGLSGCASGNKFDSAGKNNTAGANARSYLMPIDHEASLPQDPARLKLLDLEQLDHFVQAELARAQNEGMDAESIYAQAFFVLLFRPNSDGSFEKVSVALRREMLELKMYEPLLFEIGERCLSDFVRTPSLAHWICLENLMSELAPQRQKPFARQILSRIAEADLTVSKGLQNARINLGLRSGPSPSSVAKELLEL
jgi:hypothetical protein